MQRAAQVHDLGRQLVALERRADLIRDTFNERDFVFLKTLARLAPNESEQSKRLSTNSDGRHERRASAKDRVEGESPGKRQISLEQAHYASIIAGLSVKRGLPPRAASIALATAYQESDIRNLDYGDRDSVGLFQQRPSQGWGTEKQLMDPYYATGEFYDALVKIKNWRTRDINDVAQAVQFLAVAPFLTGHMLAVDGGRSVFL